MKRKRYPQNLEIKKSTGNMEKFSPAKLHRSLRFAGLSKRSANRIVDEVKREVYTGSSTKDIFRHAYNLVSRESMVAAVHYSLKKALLELGPTGFVFETFVSKLLKEAGYKTSTGFICQGKWVKHEVDVVATLEDKKYFVECKFHNDAGRKNDIKVALYVKARWDDLKDGPEGKDLTGYFLASNTAFTSDALTYAAGTGLRLLGVNAPQDKSFIAMVEERKLYPITSLPRLKKIYRQQLLSKNIILCKELLENRGVLEKLGMDEKQIDILFEDIRLLTIGKEKV